MVREIRNKEHLVSTLEELTDFLSGKVHPDCLFDCKLVASEMIGNVLRHSDGIGFFESFIDGENVLLKFRSEPVFIPPEKTFSVGVDSESGRGLFLVDSVCSERTVSSDGTVTIRIKIIKP